MENKKGSGIFLGVVAVATLVVAIIGATFAYFSITAQSAENAVDVTAYEFSASLVVEPVYPVSTDTYKGLIPLDPDATVANVNGANNTNLLYAINTAEHRCVDSGGYQVCAVYRLTFTNTSTQAMTLSGVLKTVVNTASTRTGATPFTDLAYRQASGSINSLTYDTETVEVEGQNQTVAVVREVPDSNEAGSNLVNIPEVTVPGRVGETDGQLIKYVIIYLDGSGDSGENATDQSAQMGAHYEGQLIFASSAGNRLTGTFTVAAPSGGE